MKDLKAQSLEEDSDEQDAEYKSEMKDGMTRHDVVRAAGWATVLLCLPLAVYQKGVIEAQEASLTWPQARDCTLHTVDIFEPPTQRRLFKTPRDVWLLNATYTYTPADGVPRKSTRVHYYGTKHPGRAKELANRIRNIWHEHGCTAYVNPSNLEMAILWPELHYEPYCNALCLAAVCILLIWYAFFEHDYTQLVGVPKYFSISVFDCQPLIWPETAFRIFKSRHHGVTTVPLSLERPQCPYILAAPNGIKGYTELIARAIIAVMWHILGVAIWLSYTSHPRRIHGGEELRVIFHVVGIALLFRVYYAYCFVTKVQDPQLLISTPQIHMDEPFRVVFQQRRRAGASSPLEYHKVVLSYTLTQSTHGPKVGKGLNRKIEKLIEEEYTFFEGYRAPSNAPGVVAVVEFPSHVCEMDFHDPSESNKVYHRWVFELRVYLPNAPLPIVISVPVRVKLTKALLAKKKKLGEKKEN